MQPLRHRTDRAHDFGLLDVKVALHRASGHVAGQHDKRRPALRRLADPGQRIGQPGPECTLTNVSSPVALA